MTSLSAAARRFTIASGLYRPARWLVRRLRPNQQRELQADVDFYRAILPPNALCFDVGANVGEKSEALLLAGARVVAFEPNPLVVPELTALAAEVYRGGGVERIFINLARRTPPVALRVFGTRVAATFNYFQTGLVLAAMGHLDPVDVATIGDALVSQHGYTSRRLGNSLDDLVRRRVLTPHEVWWT